MKSFRVAHCNVVLFSCWLLATLCVHAGEHERPPGPLPDSASVYLVGIALHPPLAPSLVLRAFCLSSTPSASCSRLRASDSVQLVADLRPLVLLEPTADGTIEHHSPGVTVARLRKMPSPSGKQ